MGDRGDQAMRRALNMLEELTTLNFYTLHAAYAALVELGPNGRTHGCLDSATLESAGCPSRQGETRSAVEGAADSEYAGGPTRPDDTDNFGSSHGKLQWPRQRLRHRNDPALPVQRRHRRPHPRRARRRPSRQRAYKQSRPRHRLRQLRVLDKMRVPQLSQQSWSRHCPLRPRPRQAGATTQSTQTGPSTSTSSTPTCSASSQAQGHQVHTAAASLHEAKVAKAKSPGALSEARRQSLPPRHPRARHGPRL